MTRVAVIGGGASGIAAAVTLVDARIDVTLIEAERHLGGHCFPVEVPDGKGGSFHVDGCVTDFNEESFTSVRTLVSRLGLRWRPICQDAAVATSDGQPVWSSIGGSLILRASFEDPERFRADVARFGRESMEVLDNPRFAHWTAEEWLVYRKYGRDFIERAFIPRAGGAFPMPQESPLRNPVRNIVRFWKIHGIIGTVSPRRMVLEGGMNTWPRAFGAWFVEHGGTLRLATHVERIVRGPSRSQVRVTHDHGVEELPFDHVVLAVPPQHALRMLHEPAPFEWLTFGGFLWQQANVCVHSDPSLMANDRALWGAYNFTLPTGESKPTWPTITFWSNRLTGIHERLPDVFVTLNPLRDPIPGSIHAEYTVVHPILRESDHDSRDRLDAIQGVDNTWFAGSWTQAPHVHESAVRSGMEAAERLLSHLGLRSSWHDRQAEDESLRTNWWSPGTIEDLCSPQFAFCPTDSNRHRLSGSRAG